MKLTTLILALLFSVQLFAQEEASLKKQDVVYNEVSRSLFDIDTSSIPAINRAGVYSQRATYSKLICAGASTLSVTSLLLVGKFKENEKAVGGLTIASGALGVVAIVFGISSINYELKAGKALRFHTTENGIGATINF